MQQCTGRAINNTGTLVNPGFSGTSAAGAQRGRPHVPGRFDTLGKDATSELNDIFKLRHAVTLYSTAMVLFCNVLDFSTVRL